MKKIITALTLLLISAMVMSTASFAWFSMSNKVEVSTLDITAEAKNGLYISAVDDSTGWDIKMDLGLTIPDGTSDDTDLQMMPVILGFGEEVAPYKTFKWQGANSTSSNESVTTDSKLTALDVNYYDKLTGSTTPATNKGYYLLAKTYDENTLRGYVENAPIALAFNYYLGTDQAGKAIYADIDWGTAATGGLRDCIAMDLYTAETDDTNGTTYTKIGTYQPDILGDSTNSNNEGYKGIKIVDKSIATTALEGHTHVFAFLYFKGDDLACTSSNAMLASAFDGIKITFYLDTNENFKHRGEYFDLAAGSNWVAETYSDGTAVYRDANGKVTKTGTQYSVKTVDGQLLYSADSGATVYMFVETNPTEDNPKITVEWKNVGTYCKSSS